VEAWWDDDLPAVSLDVHSGPQSAGAVPLDPWRPEEEKVAATSPGFRFHGRGEGTETKFKLVEGDATSVSRVHVEYNEPAIFASE
jgi:hypothetical protein